MNTDTRRWGVKVVLILLALAALGPAAPKKPRTQKQPAKAPAPPSQTECLRAAIEDLMDSFGKRYPGGADYLRRLETLEKTADKAALDALAREALIANPLVKGQPILYVARKQYPGDHHNTATMFQTDEINTGKYRGRGYLRAIDFAKDGTVRTILDPGPTSIPRDPELSFDSGRIVFSMRRSVDDNYHIYEVKTNGSGLKQLTSAPGVFDIDPLYLADGSIAFTSSREPKYCMCNRHIMGNMFRMDADGANIHQIGKSTLHEGHGSLMPDGRILYDRWEYVDRNFGDAQGLWTVNPDGTRHAIYWGNNTGSPGAVLDARIIPGTAQCVCTFSSCHDRPWGAMAVIDRRKGVDGREPVDRIWPASAMDLVKVTGHFDTFKRVKPKYEDPYPLADLESGAGAGKYFLVSRTVGKGEQTGIYLLDVFGNELLLHKEDELGCFDPIPIAPRTRPRNIPTMRDYRNASGTFFVQDVYVGTHMKGIERGSVKALRVVESPEKRNWSKSSWGGQGVHCPAMNWHNFENKRILGTVPVAADGSACFEAPSDRFVFFQLLDENGMMLQSMRSGTIIQSGEMQGCVGCHERRVEDTPAAPAKSASAPSGAPPKLNGWYGEPRLFSFQDEVQPVFDKHCVKCHDFGKPAGKKLVLAGDRAVSFSASYTDLWSLQYIKCVGAGPSLIQEARSWGSHASKLVSVLREGRPQHKDLKLSKEDLDRIITWVDINAPYYPHYECAYPNNPCGRAPIDGNQFKRLQQLTGAKFVTRHCKGPRAQVSFDRPELSPCLTKLDKEDPKYKEALGIIQAGREQLRKAPRGDMAGFVPCEKDRERVAKYEQRQSIEKRNREAIDKGLKVYDEDLSMVDER